MQRKRGTGRGPRVVATVDERTKELIRERSEALGWSESAVVAEMIAAGIDAMRGLGWSHGTVTVTPSVTRTVTGGVTP